HIFSVDRPRLNGQRVIVRWQKLQRGKVPMSTSLPRISVTQTLDYLRFWSRVRLRMSRKRRRRVLKCYATLQRGTQLYQKILNVQESGRDRWHRLPPKQAHLVWTPPA